MMQKLPTLIVCQRLLFTIAFGLFATMLTVCLIHHAEVAIIKEDKSPEQYYAAAAETYDIPMTIGLGALYAGFFYRYGTRWLK